MRGPCSKLSRRTRTRPCRSAKKDAALARGADVLVPMCRGHHELVVLVRLNRVGVAHLRVVKQRAGQGMDQAWGDVMADRHR